MFKIDLDLWNIFSYIFQFWPQKFIGIFYIGQNQLGIKNFICTIDFLCKQCHKKYEIFNYLMLIVKCRIY